MPLRSHTLPEFRRGQPTNRLTGGMSIVSFAVIALSGYLIQVSTTPILMTIWFWAHVVSGCTFVVEYGFHFAIGWPIGRRLRQQVLARTAR